MLDERLTEKTEAEKNAEYWAALEKWMDNIRSISATCNLLSNFTFPMMMGGTTLPPPMATPFHLPPAPPMAFAYNNFPHQVPIIAQPTVNIPAPPEFVEYRIPPLWKRFAAETIDFVFLFLLKLWTTYFAMDYLNDNKNVKKYISILQNDETVDYNLAVEITTEILMLELVHRLLVCAYEGYMIAQPGGATPGKSLMGLRVVTCTQVLPGAAPNTVRVSPAESLSTSYSIVRAILKNLVVGILLPICFPAFFYRYNRCWYDHFCRCIVVEVIPPVPPRR